MQYLKVKNWEEFQQYKDREPKWIKVYRSLLMDYKYEQLTDMEFGQLVKIWLLASQLDNCIPNDLAWIQKKAGLTSKPNIDKYLQLDFLQVNGSVSNCTDSYEVVPREDKIREETDKNRVQCTEYIKPFLGTFQNVKLTEEEQQKLKERFGEDKTQKQIESLSEYISSKGKKYHSHYATILSWARKDGDYGKQGDDTRHDNLFLRPIRKEAGPTAS